MNAFYQIVDDNQDALLTAGVKQELIDELKDNAEALSKADAEQESSKGGRSNATQARVIALNALYARVLMLDQVSDVAFDDNPAKVAYYDLPSVPPKADDQSDEEDTPPDDEY